MKDEMKRIAVLTSGGDAPGMNAAIRAVVRTGLHRGWTVFGVRQGYTGLIGGDMIPMGPRDVSNILQQGGTILGTSRCPEFETEAGQRKALKSLEGRHIDALVVIGGNGSQTGANALSQMGYPVVGIASTIDNDLYGSDMTLGVDTALNIILEAIDRIKTTASSHQRAFVIEVMGRGCGYLALMAGIAGGAEYVAIPEIETDPEKVAAQLRADYQRGKKHAIVVVAEGANYNAQRLSQYFQEQQERLGFDLRVTILGHVQRGGAPTAFDRLLGTRMGAGATEQLAQGKHGILVGTHNGLTATTLLTEVVANKKRIDLSLFELARALNE